MAPSKPKLLIKKLSLHTKRHGQILIVRAFFYSGLFTIKDIFALYLGISACVVPCIEVQANAIFRKRDYDINLRFGVILIQSRRLLL